MQNIVLISILMICLITDIKRRKIYNVVLLPALVLGVIINTYVNGWTGFLQSGQGMLLGLGMLLIPFILGGIGAGDVKLLATIGAIKGTEFTLYTFLGMGIAGGVIAVVMLMIQGRFVDTIKRLFQGLWIMVTSRFKVITFSNKDEKNLLPYGVAIVVGASYALMIMG